LFEKAYGPEGEWVRLFRRDARYQGTRLLKDTARERVYVTVDNWESRAEYEAFREKWAEEYAEIDRKCEALTATETRLAETES
jgi:hypothetical protein